MWDEVDAASKDVGRLVDPLRVDRGVETLDMAPSRLFVGGVLVVVAKANAHDVVRSEICLMALVMAVCDSRCGRLLATSVVLMRSSDGLPMLRSRVMLTCSFSLL